MVLTLDSHLCGRWHGEAVTEKGLPQYVFAGRLVMTQHATAPPQRGELWVYDQQQFLHHGILLHSLRRCGIFCTVSPDLAPVFRQ